MPKNDRFTFTPTQLEQYFERIALPQSKRVFNVSDLKDEERMSYLKTLLKHQQVRIPFENLTQHYSWHRVIDVTPLHIFRKVISQPGRGGYCMEDNSLFHFVLYSLGFDCYVAAARVKTLEHWTGWTHLVNLVTIDRIKYLCDVGFGSSQPVEPIPLHHGAVASQIAPAESRLVFETLSEYVSDCKVWICQFRVSSESDWTPIYCFSEMEILPTDIPGMNYSPWLSRTIMFTQKIVCVRFTTDKETDRHGLPGEEAVSDSKIDGTMVMDQDRLKWRRHGKTVLDVELESEEARVDALKTGWGIELDIEDREAILGTVSALKRTT